MKKTKIFYASAIMMACAFGMQSCSIEDNPYESSNSAKQAYEYDFKAAAADEIELKNQNGNTNSWAFPCWRESSHDKYSNEWKGYVWQTGSVLPEVCHVWTSKNFRYYNQLKDGGLVLGQDCEVAVDGLQVGSTVQIFYNAPEKTEQSTLQDVPFNDVSATQDKPEAFGKDAVITGTAGYAWVIGESTGQPYGDGNVNNFADLSNYSKLIVEATEGTPRFLFNREYWNSQWNEDESQSALIEYPKADNVWSAKYFTVEDIEGGKRYIVDLAQIYKDKGWVHLHAIKGANWQNVTVTKMELESYPYTEKMIWAVGDGSSNNNGKPLTTALVEGVEAVSGETEVLSGAEIKVLTTTPFKTTTGHIVVSAKKGMVITKVVIDDAIKE